MNMGFAVLVTTALFSSLTLAQMNSFDELTVGSRSRTQIQNDVSSPDADIINRLNAEILKSCNDYGCAIGTTTTKRSGWEFKFSFGDGGYNNGAGNNYYIGATPEVKSSDTSYGVSISYSSTKCQADFRIPQEEFTNLTRRVLSQREAGTEVGMKKMNSDDQFLTLVNLEIRKQLASAGCYNK